MLEKFIDLYIEDTIEFMRRNCKEVVTTVDNNICQSLFRILDCYFQESYVETEIKKITAEEVTNLETVLESLFIFALVWSICCTVDHTGREKLDKYIR